jgi:[FeFe] hydrogenase H-cluster maturation GTPase HydF
MNETPQGLRLHIGIFGRRNVGKSSLLNGLTGQEVSIVSSVPGTTTDVVHKPMELKPLGPVLFLDTAGFDDTGELGAQRVAKTAAVIDRIDLAFIVTDDGWGEAESMFAQALSNRAIPIIAVFNKMDLRTAAPEQLLQAQSVSAATVLVSARTGSGFEQLRQAIVLAAPKDYFDQPSILADLVSPGDLVFLVVPIDLEAPKGRLILPQVQVLREILDCDARALMVKERELADTLLLVKRPPRLVVTDSQVILKVVADLPPEIPVTGFSVLFARWKGDLETFVKGAGAVDRLRPGDRILMLEACTHHPIGDDIGRVKIPRWLTQYVGGKLEFEHRNGHDFPEDLSAYQLIIHCGSCMTNRREVLTRILKAREAGVPITNYGLVIAKSLGVLKRILSPFPGIQEER